MQRGYGRAHQALRAKIVAKVDRGHGVCARCGRSMLPTGQPCTRCGKPTKKGGHAQHGYCGVDLGHVDQDRRFYQGEEHACCNRQTAGRRAYRLARQIRARAEDWL